MFDVLNQYSSFASSPNSLSLVSITPSSIRTRRRRKKPNNLKLSLSHTAPPTNLSTYDAWTVGAVFYSTLFVAEALGPTGTAQVTDLQANGANMFTPAYAVYENGEAARVVLINYVSDASGASTYTANISLSGSSSSSSSTAAPSEVYVKYLLAPSVAEKTNITWASQVSRQFLVDIENSQEVWGRIGCAVC